jgi:hypothetical protein
MSRDELQQQLTRLTERRKTLEAELEFAASEKVRAETARQSAVRLRQVFEDSKPLLTGARKPRPEEFRGLMDVMGITVSVETISHNRKKASFPLRIQTYVGGVQCVVTSATIPAYLPRAA